MNLQEFIPIFIFCFVCPIIDFLAMRHIEKNAYKKCRYPVCRNKYCLKHSECSYYISNYCDSSEMKE